MEQFYSTSSKVAWIEESSFHSEEQIFRATYIIRLPGMRMRARASHDEVFSLLRALHNSGFFGA